MGKKITLGRLPEEAYDDLRSLADFCKVLGGDLEALDTLPLEDKDLLAERISSASGESIADCRTFLDAALNVHGLQNQLPVEPDELILALRESVHSYADDALQELWDEQQNCIRHVLSPEHPLGLLEKSRKLAHSHEAILNDSEIITDVRPVFDGPGEEVLQFVVTHLLKLTIREGSDRRDKYVALDNSDLRQLISQCERGLRKADAVADGLRDADWTVGIIGEEEYDD